MTQVSEGGGEGRAGSIYKPTHTHSHSRLSLLPPNWRISAPCPRLTSALPRRPQASAAGISLGFRSGTSAAMYSSSYPRAKFSHEAKQPLHRSRGKSCGYYMRIIFLFSSLIQSLIIVSLVLFLIYGQPEQSAEEKRVKVSVKTPPTECLKTSKKPLKMSMCCGFKGAGGGLQQAE